MKVVVVSNFRNSAHGQAQRFMEQVARLRDELAKRGDRMRVIAVYGDCIDATEQVLIDCAVRHQLAMTLVARHHGGPVFGSTEQPERLRALSFVMNGGLEAILDQDDAVFYVESDLLWSPETPIALLDQLGPNIDMIAPLVFAGKDEQQRPIFYDVFVYRKDGARFSPFYPYHPRLNINGVIHVDSVGSAFVMRGEVGRSCRVRNDAALLGFCEDVWAHEWTINVDARLAVHHP